MVSTFNKISDSEFLGIRVVRDAVVPAIAGLGIHCTTRIRTPDDQLVHAFRGVIDLILAIIVVQDVQAVPQSFCRYTNLVDTSDRAKIPGQQRVDKA